MPPPPFRDFFVKTMILHLYLLQTTILSVLFVEANLKDLKPLNTKNN